MSVWQCTPSATPLCGREGELVAVSISVSPRDLEALLEGLACVDFPINPQIHHAEGEPSGAGTVVEFLRESAPAPVPACPAKCY